MTIPLLKKDFRFHHHVMMLLHQEILFHFLSLRHKTHQVFCLKMKVNEREDRQ
jgi:hypothetical protein